MKKEAEKKKGRPLSIINQPNNPDWLNFLSGVTYVW